MPRELRGEITLRELQTRAVKSQLKWLRRYQRGIILARAAAKERRRRDGIARCSSWAAVNMRTISAKLTIKEAERFKRACALVRRTQYEVLQECARQFTRKVIDERRKGKEIGGLWKLSVEYRLPYPANPQTEAANPDALPRG